MHNMLELLFPRELRRLDYFVRSLPLNIFTLAGMASLGTTSPYTGEEILLCIAVIAAGLYTFGFVYLPRIRDAGLPVWSLVFALIPVLSNAFGLLLLFRPSRYSPLRTRSEKPDERPIIAGSHCSVCGKHLIFSTEGLVTESNQVVCTECHANSQAPTA